MNQLLTELSKSDRNSYFREWSKMEKINFLSFLDFLRHETLHIANNRPEFNILVFSFLDYRENIE